MNDLKTKICLRWNKNKLVCPCGTIEKQQQGTSHSISLLGTYMEQIVFTYMMQFACHTADGPMDSVTAPSCKRTWASAYQSKGILRICIIPSNKSLITSNRSINYYPSAVSGEVQLAASACHNTWSNKWFYYFTIAWFTKRWVRITTLPENVQNFPIWMNPDQNVRYGHKLKASIFGVWKENFRFPNGFD